MNTFNICPSCTHRNSCALTAEKDKVWSCSEFDDIERNQTIVKKINEPERELVLI